MSVHSYATIVKQIKVEIGARSVLPRVLIGIIFDYSGDDVDIEILAEILAIRTKPYEIEHGMVSHTNWEYVLQIGLSGHHERRKMFFMMANTCWKRGRTNRGLYRISLCEALRRVNLGNYFYLAIVLRQMLYKPYRPNVDKLTYLGDVLREILTTRATVLLARFVRRRGKK